MIERVMLDHLLIRACVVGGILLIYSTTQTNNDYIHNLEFYTKYIQQRKSKSNVIVLCAYSTISNSFFLPGNCRIQIGPSLTTPHHTVPGCCWSSLSCPFCLLLVDGRLSPVRGAGLPLPSAGKTAVCGANYQRV